MSGWNLCKRSVFIRRVRKLGFDRFFSGTRHQFMVWQSYRLTILSNQEYSVPQLRMMIRELEAINSASDRSVAAVITATKADSPSLRIRNRVGAVISQSGAESLLANTDVSWADVLLRTAGLRT